MHLRSLESTQEARVALGCASSNSYASFVLISRALSMNRFLYNLFEFMDLDYISLQVISFVGAVLLVACTVSISSFGSVKVCVI